MSTKPVIHDHYDGSAHCLQCEGSCRLTGADRVLTELVRFLFEQAAYSTSPCVGNPLIASTLTDAGVDFPYNMNRAKSTVIRRSK